jgi:hypothetical protein
MAGFFKKLAKVAAAGIGSTLSLLPIPGAGIAGKIVSSIRNSIKTESKGVDSVSQAANNLITGKTAAAQNTITPGQAADYGLLFGMPKYVVYIVGGLVIAVILFFALFKKKRR